jgi:hypothetical protein
VVSFELDELPPGVTKSYNVTVRPKLYGVYESTRARMKYNNGNHLSEDELEPEIKQGYSSSLGRIRIISKVEDDRNNEYFIKQWIIFALIYGIPTLIPFMLWKKNKDSFPVASEFPVKSKGSRKRD